MVMMRIIQDCTVNKVASILEKHKEGNAGIVFTHGLGDCVLFMPLFNALVKQFPKWNISLCLNPVRNYSFLTDKSFIVSPPYGSYSDKFDFMFSLQYFEPPRNEHDVMKFCSKYNVDTHIARTISKPYVCNLLEIGLKDFQWEPFCLKINTNPESMKIGVHFFGRPSGAIRNCELPIVEKIWKEIQLAGFEPFEVQMFSPDVPFCKPPSFIKMGSTLRNYEPSLGLMGNVIANCRYFFGVDSGPMYFATSILGFDRCIGLERKRYFSKVLPHTISTIDIENYVDGSVMNMIYKKEN